MSNGITELTGPRRRVRLIKCVIFTGDLRVGVHNILTETACRCRGNIHLIRVLLRCAASSTHGLVSLHAISLRNLNHII